MKNKLSICIPTYNRAKFLKITLQSILEQKQDIEIIISDNCSQDNTSELVYEFQKKYPLIFYHKWKENVGADRNFLKVVELATSNFCWFMGSDDIVEPGGVQKVLEVLEKHPDLTGASVSRFSYDFDMKKKYPELPALAIDHDYMFTDTSECYKKLGHYFGFISGQIINRNKWLNACEDKNLQKYFQAYIHVYIIAKMLKVEPYWYYISTPCVGWRSGNDSFLSEGYYRRLEIDVKGYESIAKDLFGKKSEVYRAHISTIIKRHIFYAVNRAKTIDLDSSFFIKSFYLCFRYYYTFFVFWYKILPLYMMPKSLHTFARFCYRNTLKSLNKPL